MSIIRTATLHKLYELLIFNLTDSQSTGGAVFHYNLPQKAVWLLLLKMMYRLKYYWYFDEIY